MSNQLEIDFDEYDEIHTHPESPFSQVLDLLGMGEYGDRGRGEVLLVWEFDGVSLVDIRVLKKRRLRDNS